MYDWSRSFDDGPGGGKGSFIAVLLVLLALGGLAALVWALSS